jgi:hypothetical protein
LKFLEEIEPVLPGLDYRYCYQLQVEDAELIGGYEQVIFVDASREELPNGYQLSEIEPSATFHFTTHRLNPASVLWLSHELYSKDPKGYLLAICGKQWELGDTLSTYASNNLKQARHELNVTG